MNRLLLADLHLTDKPLDEYRWEIFNWVDTIHNEYNINELYILGDLTDKKDNHSSELVNRLSTKLVSLGNKMSVFILRGNHDAIGAKNPFFEFSNNLCSGNDIFFVDKQSSFGDIMFIPYIRDILEFEYILNNVLIPNGHLIKYIFMHQPFIGARAQNNFIISKGLKPSVFDNLPYNIKIYSGDIHAPQKVGRIEYIGAPYHVTFGDSFDGGGLLLQDDNPIYLKFNTLKRHGITISNEMELDNYKFNNGDQAKVRVELFKEDFYKWDLIKKHIKEYLKEKDVILVSLEIAPKKKEREKSELRSVEKESNNEVLYRFCKRESLSDRFSEIGETLLCK